jgi:hypothetical protein
MTMRSVSVGALLLLYVLPEAYAFAPQPSLKSKVALQAPSTRRSAILPEHVDSMSVAIDHLQYFSSILLSDATETVPVQDGGWWSNYLGLFKSFLSFIHSTIDQPLRDQGITQTWGVSIALFTAGRW